MYTNEIGEASKQQHHVKVVYVYEAPLRLWHWVNAASVVVLMLTGYLIGKPLPSVPGDATENFVLGYIRFAHFAAAHIFVVAFLGRIYWALAGNAHARQLFMLPIFRLRWWGEVLFELKWYLFLVDKPKKYIGHNPLARLMMFLFVVIGAGFMFSTGFALYSEGAGQDHWSDWLFGWIIPFAGGSMQLHSLHRAGMWMTLLFVMIHIYAAIREDIVSRQSLIATMISGWRTFKD